MNKKICEGCSKEFQQNKESNWKMEKAMNCWHCKTELRWESDSDWEDNEGNQCLVTYLSCPNCKASVEVYLPNQDEDNG